MQYIGPTVWPSVLFLLCLPYSTIHGWFCACLPKPSARLLAQAVLRERQACDLTLGWPVLRRCALRMGENLAYRGLIDVAEDGFFLLAKFSGRGDLRERVAERKQRWEKLCRLAALSATRSETYTAGYLLSKP